MLIIIVITPILFYAFNQELVFELEASVILIIFTLIIYTLLELVKAYILLNIIYHFSSQSVSFLIISQIFVGSLYEIIRIATDDNPINNKDIIFIVLEIIGIFFILFAALVYDEVIIINKYKLNENVRLKIIGRSETDMEMNTLEGLPSQPMIALKEEDIINN
jgi:hypothetical protein